MHNQLIRSNNSLVNTNKTLLNFHYKLLSASSQNWKYQTKYHQICTRLGLVISWYIILLDIFLQNLFTKLSESTKNSPKTGIICAVHKSRESFCACSSAKTKIKSEMHRENNLLLCNPSIWFATKTMHALSYPCIDFSLKKV